MLVKIIGFIKFHITIISVSLPMVGNETLIDIYAGDVKK